MYNASPYESVGLFDLFGVQASHMNRRTFVVSLSVSSALLVWAFNVRDKNGLAIFFLGAALLLFTFAVGWLRRNNLNSPSTDKSAVLFALMGMVLGGSVGARFGFGRLVIQVFNPELMVQDYGVSLGTTGGGILGAFVFVLLLVVVRYFAVEPVE